MNVTGHRAYTIISNQNKPRVQKNVATHKPLLSFPMTLAPSKGKSALEETSQDVKTRLSKKFALVQDESIQLDETMLDNVANNEKSSFELDRVLTSISQHYKDEKNHATASGETLSHFSVELSQVTTENSHSFQVETWWKRDDGKGSVNHVKPLTIDDFLAKRQQQNATVPSLDAEKQEAKERFQYQDRSQGTNHMNYNIHMTQPFLPSSYSHTT